MLNARQPFCAQRPGSRDAQGRGGRWEVEETLWVVKLVLAGIVLVLFSIQSASPQFSQSQFLQIQVDVSGGSGRPTDDSDPIDGGNGGTIEIQTGIDVDGGDGSGHILSGTRRLQNGVHQFESVTKQAVITIAGDDVVIKCRNRFVPQKIIGEYTPGGPIPKVTIFVGQGANSDPPFPPFDGMAVLLTPFDDSGTPIMDSRGRAFSGGTFRLFTGWTNAIYPSTLKAVGGNGVAGGRGGRGGTVKISSFQQGAASAYLVGVDGGMGGGFAAFVQSKNLGSAGAGGDGGDAGSIFAFGSVLGSLYAFGGNGGDGAAGAGDLKAGGRGGNGGQGGCIEMATTSESPPTPGAGGGNGGQGGEGAAGAAVSKTSSATDGEAGGRGGDGGDAGDVLGFPGDPQTIGNLFRPGRGGDGGNGGDGGAGLPGDGSVSGNGGDGGNGGGSGVGLEKYRSSVNEVAGGQGGGGGKPGPVHPGGTPGQPGQPGSNGSPGTYRTVGVCFCTGPSTGPLPQLPATLAGHGWSMNLSYGDDGVVLRDVTLGAHGTHGSRYMARQISVPYFVIATTRMAANGLLPARGRLQVRSDPAETLSSSMVDFRTSMTDEKLLIEGVFLIRNLPSGSPSCLLVIQRYEFLTEAASLAFEPSGQLHAQRFRAPVKYIFMGTDGEELGLFKVAQRSHYAADARPNNSTGVFRDASYFSDLFYFAGAIPMQNDGINALRTEVFGSGIRRGQQSDWDNIHVTFVDRIQTPIARLGSRSIPHGAAEAVHMHWRWNGFIADRLGVSSWKKTRGEPLIDQGSNQDLDFAVVRYRQGEESPESFSTLLNGDALTDGTQVVWLLGTGYHQRDEFFAFGGAFEPEIRYVRGPDITAGTVLDFSHLRYRGGKYSVRAYVRSKSDYELIRGPLFVVLDLPPDVSVHKPDPEGDSGGKPYFRLQNLGRDEVLHPAVSTLFDGELTTDWIELIIPESVVFGSSDDFEEFLLAISHRARVYSGTPPPR